MRHCHSPCIRWVSERARGRGREQPCKCSLANGKDWLGDITVGVARQSSEGPASCICPTCHACMVEMTGTVTGSLRAVASEE